VCAYDVPDPMETGWELSDEFPHLVTSRGRSDGKRVPFERNGLRQHRVYELPEMRRGYAEIEPSLRTLTFEWCESCESRARSRSSRFFVNQL
jgi:hypothetical protein